MFLAAGINESSSRGAVTGCDESRNACDYPHRVDTLLAALTVRAEAVTEFCPATVENASPIGARLGTAAPAYAYELQALTPRAVDASMIADTDHGWFSWRIAGATLHSVTRTDHVKVNGRNQPEQYAIAESGPLAVAFPLAVVIHHAWVVHGKTSGEVKLGWDARGPTSCDPPGFASASMTDPPKAPSAQAMPTPLPSADGAATTAVPTSPPFAITTCATPFAEATVTRPVAPDFSNFELIEDRLGGAAASVVAVAVDEHGKQVDTWILSSSGVREFRSGCFARGTGLRIFRCDFILPPDKRHVLVSGGRLSELLALELAARGLTRYRLA